MAEEKPVSKQSGGVNIAGGSVAPGEDVVGRDKITIIQQAAIAQTSVALHQLQAPPADFTGRTDEFEELLTAVKAKGARIVGIVGLGGSGKTTLALKLAEELTSDFPDAQFQIDLKGTSKEPLAPKEAMAHVIRGFDLTAKVPENESEVAALYRSVLHKKKVLLFLDNAREGKQVEPLIPPQGSLLLVTARFHFPISGLFEKNLDAMKPADAEALLVRIAPRVARAECTAELARLCGNLPLALRTAASALQVKRNLRPVDYVSRLQDTAKRLKELDEVQLSLQVSYELLPEELKQKLRFLAVFPDTFDARAAASVWEVEQGIADESLEKLLLYSLIDFDEAIGRYRLHDLVRLFADDCLSATEREISQQRHAGHYLQVLGAADDLYEKGGAAVLKSLALFDLEWANIQTGQTWATAHADTGSVAADWCLSYPVRGPNLLDLRQPPRVRIHWLEAALATARRLDRRQIESIVLGNLGLAYYDLGEYQRAVEYHEHHLKIARKVGDRGGEGRALGNLGIAYSDLGEHRRATEYHEQQLQIAREIGDRQGEGHAIGNLGLAAYSLGEYRQAIEYCDQHLQIARQMGDRRGEGQTLGNLANVYDALGEYQRAIEHYEQRLRIADEIGDRRGEANALWNSSTTLDAQGDRAHAIMRAEAALEIYEAIESPAATEVRNQLAKWREEEKAKGRAAGESNG